MASILVALPCAATAQEPQPPPPADEQHGPSPPDHGHAEPPTDGPVQQPPAAPQVPRRPPGSDIAPEQAAALNTCAELATPPTRQLGRTTTLAPDASDPIISPSSADLLAAALTLRPEDQTTTIGFSPFMLASETAAWGLQTAVSYVANSDDHASDRLQVSLGYRLQWTWLLAYDDEVRTDMRQVCTAVLPRSYRPVSKQLHRASEAVNEWDDEEWTSMRALLRGPVDDARNFANAATEISATERQHFQRLAEQALTSIAIVDAHPEDHEARRVVAAQLHELDAALDALAPEIQASADALPADANPADEVDRGIMRRLDYGWYSFLPTLYFGGLVGFFPANFGGMHSEGLARDGFAAELSGRATVLFEYRLAFSRYEARPSPVDDTAAMATGDQSRLGLVYEVSTSAVVVLPWLVGTHDHDEYWLREGMQRGIGVGFYANWLGCEPSAPGGCADNLADSLSVGGLIDLRVTKEIRPRLRLGVRRTRDVAGASQDGVDAQLVMSFAIDADG